MGARRMITIASAALLLVALVPATAASACSGDWTFKSTERGLADLINISRQALGKHSLRLDPELSRAARKHTAEMMRKKRLYHTPFSVMARRVTNWVKLGENVGLGKTVNSLHKAFMRSRSHRGNILFSKYRHVGIGM